MSGAIVCYLSDGEGVAKEEGPIFFTGVSGSPLALIVYFSWSNLSNFSNLDSNQSLFCRMFFVCVAGASSLEPEELVNLCVPFVVMVSEERDVTV